MKLSLSKSQLQGENNHETHATRPRSSRPLRQHFGNPNRSYGRRRRRRNQLRPNPVQAVAATSILHLKNSFVERNALILRKPNKERAAVATLCNRRYSSGLSYVGAAFTSVALPVGCAQHPRSEEHT